MEAGISMGLSAVPLSYESHEEARAAATAAKRKLWRVQGALAALDELESRPELPAREALLVEVEAEVDRAHRGLAELLERTDGGSGTSGTRLQFFHLTMQEYLAARHLCFHLEEKLEKGAGFPRWITREGRGSDFAVGAGCFLLELLFGGSRGCEGEH